MSKKHNRIRNRNYGKINECFELNGMKAKVIYFWNVNKRLKHSFYVKAKDPKGVIALFLVNTDHNKVTFKWVLNTEGTHGTINH